MIPARRLRDLRIIHRTVGFERLREGGGRKSLSETDPGLLEALKLLVEPMTRGDPMSALR